MDLSKLVSKTKPKVPEVTVAAVGIGAKPATKQTTLRIVGSSTKRSGAATTNEVIQEVTEVPDTAEAIALERGKRKVGLEGSEKDADDSVGRKRAKPSGVALTDHSFEVFSKSPHCFVEDHIWSKVPRAYWEGKSIDDIKSQALFYQALSSASTCQAMRLEESARSQVVKDLDNYKDLFEKAKKQFEDTQALLGLSWQRVLDLEAAEKTHAQTLAGLGEAQQQVGIARSLGIEYKSTADDQGAVTWTGGSKKIELRARADFQKTHAYVESALSFARERLPDVFRPLLAPEDSLTKVVKLFEAFPEGDKFVTAFASDSFIKGLGYNDSQVNDVLAERFGDKYDHVGCGMPEDCIQAWETRVTEEQQPAAEEKQP